MILFRWIKSNPIAFVLIIIASVIIIKTVRDIDVLKTKGELSIATVTQVLGGSNSSPPGVEYSFVYNDMNYIDKFRGLAYKDIYLGKKFYVVFDPQNPSLSEIIIEKKEIEKYSNLFLKSSGLSREVYNYQDITDNAIK